MRSKRTIVVSSSAEQLAGLTGTNGETDADNPYHSARRRRARCMRQRRQRRYPAGRSAGLRCADSVTSDSATISSASSVTTPVTISGVNVNTRFCRVQGMARPSSDSEIKFEVWLPATADAWTGRFKLNGTGGYAGATPYRAACAGRRRRHRHRRQQHGPRRRRVGQLDAQPPGEGEGLGPARALLRRHRRQGGQPGVLRHAGVRTRTSRAAPTAGGRP